MKTIVQTQATSTPSILTGAAVAANLERTGLIIQNVGSNPLFINFGGTASNTVFHIVLSAGTGDSDGIGGIYISDALVFTGAITFAGTSPKYVVTEFGK